MKVFLSYSTGDLGLVRLIANQLRHNAEVFYWEGSKVPGTRAWEAIYTWIDQCDLVLVVITDHTVTRAMSVGQEIGRAVSKSKTIIPLVAPDVQPTELGCLNGITYQPIDRYNPGPALHMIEWIVLQMKEQIERQQAIFLFGGILTLVWLAGRKR